MPIGTPLLSSMLMRSSPLPRAFCVRLAAKSTHAGPPIISSSPPTTSSPFSISSSPPTTDHPVVRPPTTGSDPFSQRSKMAAEKKHIILVHGAGMGAWCWYKVSTALRSAGHRVTVPDLAASGIDERKLTDVTTFREYSKPLLEIMASLPVGDKVVLVGHSLGGINIALATEEFPEKVSAAVFVTAHMPDFTSRPSYVIEKFLEEGWISSWMDTEMKSYKVGDKLIASLSYGPQFLQSMLCQLCSPEDFTLITSLARSASLFIEDLQNQPPFSQTRYGSVDMFYVVCSQDLAIPDPFQHWMIENKPVKEVRTIEGADHVAMLSTPKELSDCLLHFASLS